MLLRDDLLKPISDANPSGFRLRDEQIFLDIEEARREDDPYDQGVWEAEGERKSADYELVVKLSSEVLATKSKDLQLAVWLTEALLRSEGYKGLREGLDLVRGLLEQFWDSLHPQLDDGDPYERRKHLSWLGGYLESAVKSVALNGKGHDYYRYAETRAVGYEKDAESTDSKKKREQAVKEGRLTPEEFDSAFEETPKPFYKELVSDLSACLESLGRLDELGQQKFEDGLPDYRKLRESMGEVSRLARELLAKKLEVDPDPEAQLALEQSLAATGAAVGPAVVSIEPTDARDAAARIAAAAAFLQQHDPTNPASYLMLRGFRWGELRSQGSDVERLLSPPPTQLRVHLKTLHKNGSWEQLLAEGEKVMATEQGRGWLDLQRYVLTACDRLGQEYQAVGAAIRGVLAALLRDLPQLPELMLMDDMPTANRDTLAWLSDEGLYGASMAAEDSGVGGGLAGSADEDALRRTALDRAMVEVRAGRPERGVEILLQEADREKSERGRFFRRSQVASIMIEAGREEIARPILRELVEIIDAHKLEDWEAREIVARPLGLLYRCMEALEGESAEAKQQLYNRICRLDSSQVLAVSGKHPAADSQEPAKAQAPTTGAATAEESTEEHGQAGS